MAGRVDDHVPLDYAEIQIFPAQNRYEVSVCGEGKIENLEDGVLELLSPHLPAVNELCSKGSNATFKLAPPRSLNGVAWFTKSTLSRFVLIVRSSNVVRTMSSIKDEMLQLEEARKFQLSLYGQPKVKNASLDTSKNELLRAMELRLTALRTELTTAFCNSASAICSSKEIADLAKFSEHFGGIDLRDSLRKLSELNQERKRGDVNKIDGDSGASKPISLDTPVIYGVSPAKAAQAERQSSTDGEESSQPSDEDKPTAERSRTLIRSASPRRSASPMRRVQIGRSGSRRAAALTIKSLNYYPGRDKSFPYRDGTGNSSEDEGSSEQSFKKPETNARRMSVQDAINLFERKQKDHTEGSQLRKSMSCLSATANKAVLRRWSSGIGETSAGCEPESEPETENAVDTDLHDGEKRERTNCSTGDKSEVESAPASQETVEIPEDDVDKLQRFGKSSSDSKDIEEDKSTVKEETDVKKSAAVTEWNRLKEAELNQMLMQMMEVKPVKYTKTQPSRKQSLPSGERGGFYDHYNKKRDEKLRGETNTKKKAEKDAQFKAMQLILDERKDALISKNLNNVEKKPAIRKSQKPLRNSAPPANLNPKKEATKGSVPKKVSPRTSPLPLTRKSWPSTPPTRAAAVSPAKTPVGNSSTSTTPTRRRTQQTSPLPRAGPKVERPQQPQRIVKEPPLVESGKNLKIVKTVKEKPQQVPKKNIKPTKTKNAITEATEENSDVVVPSKTGLYGKVTKKSSVVPVETKPFLRKGSRAIPNANPNVNKRSPQSEDPQKNTGNSVETQEIEVVRCDPEPDVTSVPNLDAQVESENPVSGKMEFCEAENSDSVAAESSNELKKSLEEFSCEIQAEEEPIISPSAWVEIEEHRVDERSLSQHASSAAKSAKGMASPRVRHSLSQMLLEESNDHDIIEWGNAENPPAILYQKDAPKGLKRLLKFARKSKGDTHNHSGFSSPSVFSEGEDDSDGFTKKASLNAKKISSSCEGFDARELYSSQSNLGKLNARSNWHDNSDSSTVSTTKATRSFFSLSAFRGGPK